MVEEMMPNLVQECKNVTRYESKCTTEMNYKEVEEERPICKVEMMKCKIGMKMMKKSYPATVCEDIAIGEEEMCVEMVKLKKEKHEAKHCSFHPKTVCQDEEGKECKMVKKKMCNYIQDQSR